MTTRHIVPPALQGVYDQWHFAPAVVRNGLIFCSGIIGTSADGNPPPGLRTGAQLRAGGSAALDGAQARTDQGAGLTALQAVRDPEAQFATAFEALRSILNSAGADLCDVIELTSYHVDISTHMDVFCRVRDGYLSAPWPAWTAIGVAELVVPGGLVELRAVAAMPG
ncbi:MAG: Rid family hydrolase [Gemmobacter sp.]|nr:Rid family hydrolase [Gemmobacter sp.]